MKLLLIAAFIAVVSSGRLSNQQPDNEQQWPWQSGKQYRYDVNSHTLARLHEGASSGNAFRAQFIVRVQSPGRLQAKLENPQQAQFHQQLANNMALPSDLSYKAAENLDKPFEISVEGGRVVAISLPSALTVSNENLLKGLISALQVDLSSHRHVQSPQDSYDKERQQGLFKKIETDVTGDCETLYSVSPVAAEWRRELPQFASEEDPMEITKSRNYGHCHHRVSYHFGVPKGAEWTGTAHKHSEKQFITHGSVSRILAGKQGPIYKAETTSSVHVHPHVYGKQKAEVHSYVSLNLLSVEEDNGSEWQKPEGTRQIKTLLYAMTTKQIAIHDSSDSESSESHEHIYVQFGDNQNEADRSERQRSDEDRNNRPGYQQSYQSSSSSDSSSAYKNDEVPKINEPAYAALYMNAQSRGDKKQNPMNAQKLLLDVAQQLQNPNNMPKAEFLTKFNILVRLIASMSTDQLAQISRSIEVGKASNSIVKADMWMIFRDAVVQAGTPPAFQQIKTWIKSKKIQTEEAAQVIASLARTLRYPTKEIMQQFFELAMSPEVHEQNLLGTTALIAATQFIRMGHVNNETAQSYYPTQMYGRLARKHDRFVVDNILPRLSEKLKQAVQNDERSKADVYIRAIGNLGHPEILNVFAPYLEGKTQASNYLRVQMVAEFKSLVDQNNKYARAVLYSILRNTAEPYEVRVAAALNMFRANPTTDMMHAMAQMTNDDPSIQVRAVLKRGILNAATLENPRYWHLAKSAQAVKDVVTSEDLGINYSTEMLDDQYDNNQQEDSFSDISYIGSDDSATMPKRFRSTWNNKISGWAAEDTVQFAHSSAQELADSIKQMIYQPTKSEANHKFSAKRISEMLNIKQDRQNPLQSSVHIDILGQERFFAFEEKDHSAVVNEVMEYMKEIEKGVDKHYTKVFNAKQVSVMFPIATGVPFIYKYKEPIVIHIQSKASGKFDYKQKNFKDVTGVMDKEIQFTFAKNIDGSVGFMDTLNNQLASAGVVKKYQVNVPVKLNVEMKSGEYKMRIQPLRPDQDSTIVHYSVWPYSANQPKDSLTPTSQDRSTKLVERPRKVVATDYKFGQQTGTIFHVQGYSYSKNFRNAANFFQALYNIEDLMAPSDIALTHYNIRYLNKQSKNKAVTLSLARDEYYNQKQSGELGQPEKQEDVQPNSAARRERMAKRVSSNINTAKAEVVDLSATFEGQQKQEYVLTGAYASSPVDNKIQGALFLSKNSAQHGNEQINAVAKMEKSETSPMSFLDALQKNMKTTYEAEVKYGQNGNIRIKGNAERSQKYTEQLRNHPLAKRCQQEDANQDEAVPAEACQKLLVKAHAPDTFKVSVNYKNLPAVQMNLTAQGLHILKKLSNYIDVNPMKRVADGKLELEADASYIDNSLRVEMTSSTGMLRLDNAQIPEFAPYLMSTYSLFGPFKAQERLGNYATKYQYQPYCTVSTKKVKTFSNRAYNYELTSSWHVLMREEESKSRGKSEELVILARKPSEQQQEIYISYKSEAGKDLEIVIPSSAAKNKANVNVKTNTKKIADGELTIYWDNQSEQPQLEYYNHQDGLLMLNIREGRIRVIFDGERLAVSTNEYRKTTIGICGKNSGEPRDDYETPNGLVDKPEYYGASFALDGENSDPKTEELKKQAQQNAYQPKTKYTAILRSDEEWQQAMERKEQEWGSQKVYRSRSYQKQRGDCQLQEQVQYHENHGELCISTTPLPSCQSHCRGEGYQVKAAQMICKSRNDQEFQSYKEQIQRGQNPQVSGVPKVEQYRVPSSCKA